MTNLKPETITIVQNGDWETRAEANRRALASNRMGLIGTVAATTHGGRHITGYIPTNHSDPTIGTIHHIDEDQVTEPH